MGTEREKEVEYSPMLCVQMGGAVTVTAFSAVEDTPFPTQCWELQRDKECTIQSPTFGSCERRCKFIYQSNKGDAHGSHAFQMHIHWVLLLLYIQFIPYFSPK